VPVAAGAARLIQLSTGAPGFRRRRPGWHRAAGRPLVPCGLIAAWSGLWMTVFYPKPPGDGAVLIRERLVFGSLMIAYIVLGRAQGQREFPELVGFGPRKAASSVQLR
jgi:hypothetical protein